MWFRCKLQCNAARESSATLACIYVRCSDGSIESAVEKEENSSFRFVDKQFVIFHLVAQLCDSRKSKLHMKNLFQDNHNKSTPTIDIRLKVADAGEIYTLMCELSVTPEMGDGMLSCRKLINSPIKHFSFRANQWKILNKQN